MASHRIPFLLPLPASLGDNRRLSTIRAWATGQVHNHARRTGCLVQGEPYAWAYDAVDEDGRPAVACMAVLVTRPTIATAVAELRDRPARAQREGRCLMCIEIARLRACDWDDRSIAARLEISPRALANHDQHGGGAT